MSLDACAKQSLRVKRGTILRLEIECADKDGAPLDMTTGTCKMQARTRYGGTVLFEATEADGITLAAGLVTVLKLVPADAQLVEGGVYDIIWTGPDGPECIGEGDFSVTDKATDLA